MNDTIKLTLNQMIDICKYINELGFDVYIEGCGNGEVKFIVEEKTITLV